MARIETWRVWAELGRRPHIEVAWAVLVGHRGRIDDIGRGRRRITIDARLDPAERRAVLAHELVHDERGILFTADVPDAVVAKEEAYVRAETCRRLVPPRALRTEVVRRLSVGGHVSAVDVADWFDVPESIAADALCRLARLEFGENDRILRML